MSKSVATRKQVEMPSGGIPPSRILRTRDDSLVTLLIGAALVFLLILVGLLMDNTLLHLIG